MAPAAVINAIPRKAEEFCSSANITPAVMTTMIDEDWKSRSLTSTENHSSRTNRAVNKNHSGQLGKSPKSEATTTADTPNRKYGTAILNRRCTVGWRRP